MTNVRDPHQFPAPARQSSPSGACEAALDALIGMQAKLRALMGQRVTGSDDRIACPRELLGQLAELNVFAQSMLHDIDRSLRDSRPAEATGRQLIARLHQLCVKFTADTGIACECNVRPEHVPFGRGVCDVLYWTVCELLTNVRKHSGATTVRVLSGARGGGRVFLRVEDNGTGSAATILRRAPYGIGRVGLWSIEHRLQQLEGRLEITGERGLAVTIVVPPWVSGPRCGPSPAVTDASDRFRLAGQSARRAAS